MQPEHRSECARRRRRLMEMAGDDVALIVPAARTVLRNGSNPYPFRQDSDFHYLCGFPEPDAVLVLVPGRAAGAAILFCHESEHPRMVYDGPFIGPEQAVSRYGLDDAFDVDDIDDILPGLLEGRQRVLHAHGRQRDFDARVCAWVERAAGVEPASAAGQGASITPLISELRLIKSALELRQMAAAIDVARAAHRAMAAMLAPGINERNLYARYLQVVADAGCQLPYQPIIAGGVRGVRLHYIDNDQPLQAGDCVLIDAGAEHQGYAADLTRVYPVDGHYSSAQRALYDCVHAAQAAAITALRVGADWDAPHQAAVRELSRGLIDLGLLAGPLDQVIKSASYKTYYPHRTGHWLGLDVHDVGDYQIGERWRELEPGMVCTVEPGLYIGADAPVAAHWRGLAVRIEDNVVVTKQGPRVLSAALPSEASAVEQWLCAAGQGRDAA